jgi:hypothetical protein
VYSVADIEGNEATTRITVAIAEQGAVRLDSVITVGSEAVASTLTQQVGARLPAPSPSR